MKNINPKTVATFDTPLRNSLSPAAAGPSAAAGLLVALVLVCFGLSPAARAVIPPPDGGYPNFNTAEGQNALFSLTTGAANTAVGWFSLFSNAEGNFNAATGAGALLFNNGDPAAFEASENTAFGAAALLFNTTGLENTAVGAVALLNNTDGNFNTAVGGFALNDNTNGNFNTAVGRFALANNTTGNSNTALGSGAGVNQTTGSGNVYIGSGTPGIAGESNACYIASIFGQTSANGISVLINSDNKLGTTTSSKRFKQEIKAMDKASEALFSLKPVSFRYKKEIDPARTPQLGLVAEDVEKVNPALGVRDKDGKPYTVRYDAVNVMLLNEFLKEHRKNEEQACTVQEQEAAIIRLKSTVAEQEAKIAQQQSTNADQQKAIEALTASLKEQAAQIQKVSDHVELSKTASQLVVNSQ